MSEQDTETLKLERHGPVLHVVLSRPEVHDAFDERMIADLTAVFHDAADDDGRVVLIRSTGKHFCAGADLNWMQRAAEKDEEENLEDAGRLEEMFRAVAACPKPVVARVQGAALGGGAGLVAAVDFAVAAERAFLGFSEARLGILPAVISPYVLRKVAPGVAQALFLSGVRFGAERGRELGLIWSVVDEEELDGAVEELIDELLQCGPVAQAAVKRLVEDVRGRTLDGARRFTTRAIAEIRAGDEGKEGVAAFLEKRKPAWTPEEKADDGGDGEAEESGGEGSDDGDGEPDDDREGDGS